jgi:hypothetical protein
MAATGTPSGVDHQLRSVTDTGEIECKTLDDVERHMRLKDGGSRP